MSIGYGKRQIRSGKEYDSLFPSPVMGAINMGNNPVLENVYEVIPAVVRDYKHEASAIAEKLYSKNTKEFAKNIWEFLFNNIQYVYDEFGREQFRTPARSWADRHEGIDCDCFSIFASSILSNKGVPHCIRITKYDNNPKWQHIYVIVPDPNKKFSQHNPTTYFVIDAVIHKFNTEKVFSEQKTFTMKENLGIVTEVLHGVETSETDVVSDILNGFDGLNGDNLNAVYQQLVKTRNWAINNPGLLKMQQYDPQAFLQMIEYAIDNFWKGEKQRDAAFEILAQNEARYNREVLDITEDDIEGFDGFEDDIDNMIDDDDVYDFDGIGQHIDDDDELERDLEESNEEEFGKLFSRKRREKRKSRRKSRRKARKQKRQTRRKTRRKVRKETKTQRKHERKQNRKRRRKERKEAKGFFRKVGVGLKQAGKAVGVKYNPAVIAARTGFLTAVRLNMFRLASRLVPAYKGKSWAKSKGKNYNASLAMGKKVEEIFADKLMGKRSALRKSVLTSKSALQGIDEPDWENIALEFAGIDSGFSGAGAITAVLSAAPILVKVINAIAEVEDQYGIEGFGSIDDDYDEMMMLMDELEDGMSGLSGDKVTLAQITAWIKKFFSKVKKRRDERKNLKSEYSKKEWKESGRKTFRAYKKDERQHGRKMNAKAGTMLKRASDFVKTMEAGKDNPDGSTPMPETGDDFDFDINASDNITRGGDDANTDNKKNMKKWLLIGGGILTLGIGGFAISQSMKKKKQLSGLSGAKAKAVKKVTLK